MSVLKRTLLRSEVLYAINLHRFTKPLTLLDQTKSPRVGFSIILNIELSQQIRPGLFKGSVHKVSDYQGREYLRATQI